MSTAKIDRLQFGHTVRRGDRVRLITALEAPYMPPVGTIGTVRSWSENQGFMAVETDDGLVFAVSREKVEIVERYPDHEPPERLPDPEPEHAPVDWGLTPDQGRRVEALRVARDVVVDGVVASSMNLSASALVYIAEWIVTGDQQIVDVLDQEA